MSELNVTKSFAGWERNKTVAKLFPASIIAAAVIEELPKYGCPLSEGLVPPHGKRAAFREGSHRCGSERTCGSIGKRCGVTEGLYWLAAFFRESDFPGRIRVEITVYRQPRLTGTLSHPVGLSSDPFPRAPSQIKREVLWTATDRH